MNTIILNKNRALLILLSCMVMGGGHLIRKHYVKGVLFLIVQICFIVNLSRIFHALLGLVTLGETAQIRQGLTVIAGDNSIFMLVEGVTVVICMLFFIALYLISIKDSCHLTTCNLKIREQVEKIYEEKFALIILIPSFIVSVAFIVMPIVITVLVSFTNYAAPGHIPPKNLVDWVGFRNFIMLFEFKIWSNTFFGVALWTFLWALCATFFTFSFGFILAMALANKQIKFKKTWRLLFILPYAIPTFVTLLIFRLLLNGIGPVNAFLNNLNIDSINFLTVPLNAKITVIAVCVWVGAPYFMLLISGALTNISRDLYEASEVDGANKWQQFKEITLPMILHQVAPTLVMTFAYNFNNFGAIYLLTEGGPANPDYRFAGDTDIFITWIYKLTLNFQQYQIASVISIMIFIFLSVIAIWQFRRMQSFKNDVGM